MFKLGDVIRPTELEHTFQLVVGFDGDDPIIERFDVFLDLCKRADSIGIKLYSDDAGLI